MIHFYHLHRRIMCIVLWKSYANEFCWTSTKFNKLQVQFIHHYVNTSEILSGICHFLTIFRKMLENVNKCSSGTHNDFGKSSEISVKWSEIFSKGSKCSHACNFKLASCFVLVWFWNYLRDYSLNCTPLGSITNIDNNKYR